MIDKQTSVKLNQLRTNGNIGSHPEKYFKKKDELVKLALQSLESARELLEFSFSYCNRNHPVPIYEVLDASKGSLKDVCYQAMIEADPEARYIAGNILLGKADELEREAIKDVELGGTGFIRFECDPLVRQAHFWFKLAADGNHAPSMYKYGVNLAEGFEGEDKISIGENIVYGASLLKNADANAFIGNCYLRGSMEFEIDLNKALSHFELAAAEDHPEALATLGAMYEKGLGVPSNSRTAFEYTRLAANAGYPYGQYNLFIFYLNGRGVDKNETVAIEWLTKAAAQSLPHAMLELAKLISDERVHGKVDSDAETLFLRCLFHDSLGNEARYELALLYITKWQDWEKWIIAANLLQECYEKEGRDTALAKKCWEISPSIIRQLRNGIKLIAENGHFLAARIVLDYFDSDGHPHKNRQERIHKLFQKAEKIAESKHVGVRQEETLLPFKVKGSVPDKVIPITRKNEKLGRNALCHCGSGKKYKNCCIL